MISEKVRPHHLERGDNYPFEPPRPMPNRNHSRSYLGQESACRVPVLLMMVDSLRCWLANLSYFGCLSLVRDMP